MASFPSALASFAGFTATNTLAADNHAAQHNLEQGEILAVQTKVGTGSSTPSSGTVLAGTGAGTSSWSQVNLTTMVTGTLPVANGGTGQNNLSGLTLPSAILSSPTVSNPTESGGTYNAATLNQPTIADFTNAQHNHSNSVGGGQLTSSAFANGAITAAKLGTHVAAGSFAAKGSTGNQSVTGLGFTPVVVYFFVGISTSASNSAAGFGYMTATTQYASAWASRPAVSVGSTNTDTTHCIKLYAISAGGAFSAQQEAAFVSLDSDGFTINYSTSTTNGDTIGYIALA